MFKSDKKTKETKMKTKATQIPVYKIQNPIGNKKTIDINFHDEKLFEQFEIWNYSCYTILDEDKTIEILKKLNSIIAEFIDNSFILDKESLIAFHVDSITNDAISFRDLKSVYFSKNVSGKNFIYLKDETEYFSIAKIELKDFQIKFIETMFCAALNFSKKQLANQNVL